VGKIQPQKRGKPLVKRRAYIMLEIDLGVGVSKVGDLHNLKSLLDYCVENECPKGAAYESVKMVRETISYLPETAEDMVNTGVLR
jgi:hypothetical protein